MGKRRRNNAPTVITPKPSSQLDTLSTSNVWLPRFWGVSIVTGLGVMRYWFYWGVFIVYVGVVLAILEICFEPQLLKRSIQLQVGLLVLVLLFFDIFSISVVGMQAPITFQSYAMKKGEYAAGTTIAGITWDSHLTDLRVAVTNPADDDYENLDVEIQPDKWTYKAALLTNPLGCELPSIGGRGATFTISKGGAKTVTANRVGTQVEAQDDAGDIFIPLGTASGYRLRCTKLPARFTVQVVFALAAFYPGLINDDFLSPNAPKGTWGFSAARLANVHSYFELFDARPIPSKVQVKGRYFRSVKPFGLENVVAVQDGN